MERTALTNIQDHPDMEKFIKIILSGRYFKDIKPDLLKNMLRKGTLLSLKKDDYLIREGDSQSTPEMYILLSGSLAVMSQEKFILRLEMPGEVVGEVGVIQSAPRSADVLAEKDTQLVAFSSEMLAVGDDATHAPIIYVMLANILAAKLKLTTAQSLIRKNERIVSDEHVRVALIDENEMDRLLVRGILESYWADVVVEEFEQPKRFIDTSLDRHFGLIIADPLDSHSNREDSEDIRVAFDAFRGHNAPVFIISKYCNSAVHRQELISLGASELVEKPFSTFDIMHNIEKLKSSYYKHLELDKIEHAADTDRLTGLANRRRLDEFMDALAIISEENEQVFSLIIADVDNFKHYNDTQGHQMGDVVLAKVAKIFGTNVRRGDLAARFGGEEFVMVLPGCDRESASEVAEKLRTSVEEEEFPFQALQPTGNLTATFGVATYPHDATTIEALLKKADECLYRGKEAGRNIVISAEC